MKPKHYNMNILDKYKDYMDQDTHEKYTWIIFFIQTITEETEIDIKLGHPNISQNNFNKLSMDKQASAIIESIKQTFITVISKIRCIDGITLLLLRDEAVSPFDAFHIRIQMILLCLKRSMTTEGVDLIYYIKTVFHNEFKKHSYNIDRIEMTANFFRMIYIIYLTKGVRDVTLDDIENNTDNVMTLLAETMKRKNREATRRYSN